MAVWTKEFNLLLMFFDLTLNLGQNKKLAWTTISPPSETNKRKHSWKSVHNSSLLPLFLKGDYFSSDDRNIINESNIDYQIQELPAIYVQFGMILIWGSFLETKNGAGEVSVFFLHSQGQIN